jgi:hypothetical protein
LIQSSVAFAHVARHGSACTAGQESKGNRCTKGSDQICNPLEESDVHRTTFST